MTADPFVLTVPEAAELLGISKDLAYDLCRRRRDAGRPTAWSALDRQSA